MKKARRSAAGLQTKSLQVAGLFGAREEANLGMLLLTIALMGFLRE